MSLRGRAAWCWSTRRSSGQSWRRLAPAASPSSLMRRVAAEPIINMQHAATVSLLCIGVLLLHTRMHCSVTQLHVSDANSGVLQVFSGLWRLGAVSAAQLLGAQPDIACYAKLLTGPHGACSARCSAQRTLRRFPHLLERATDVEGNIYTPKTLSPKFMQAACCRWR